MTNNRHRGIAGAAAGGPATKAAAKAGPNMAPSAGAGASGTTAIPPVNRAAPGLPGAVPDDVADAVGGDWNRDDSDALGGAEFRFGQEIANAPSAFAQNALPAGTLSPSTLSPSSAGFDTDPESSLEAASDPEAADSVAYGMWIDLVERIRCGHTDGMAELYHLFSKGIRFYLCRQLGAQELDDKVHDTFVVVVQAIRRGELREPQRLMGFVRTIVRRQVAAYIDKAVHTRREQMDMESTVRIADPRGNPEEAAMFRQRVEMIRRVLAELPSRDREILTRFYLREQSQDQICKEMSLTETQFRLLKSRAKSRFGELGKKKLASRALHAVFMRTSAGNFH